MRSYVGGVTIFFKCTISRKTWFSQWSEPSFKRKSILSKGHVVIDIHPYIGGSTVFLKCKIPRKTWFTQLSEPSFTHKSMLPTPHGGTIQPLTSGERQYFSNAKFHVKHDTRVEMSTPLHKNPCFLRLLGNPHTFLRRRSDDIFHTQNFT